MTYSYIYIIGTGKVAKECQKIANDFFRQEVNFVKNIENLDDFFKNLKNCLIISANNFYIFKKILLLITTTHYCLFTEDVMHIFGVYGKTIKKQVLLGIWLKKV